MVEYIRAQCVVIRNGKLLMVRHRHARGEWWCLPGGGVKQGETPAEAAIRELREECGLEGVIVRQISHMEYAPDNQQYTFLVEVGDQVPHVGSDPEFGEVSQILVDVKWLSLSEIPARDRAYLWASGLLGVESYRAEVAAWGESISYPRHQAPGTGAYD